MIDFENTHINLKAIDGVGKVVEHVQFGVLFKPQPSKFSFAVLLSGATMRYWYYNEKEAIEKRDELIKLIELEKK